MKEHIHVLHNVYGLILLHVHVHVSNLGNTSIHYSSHTNHAHVLIRHWHSDSIHEELGRWKQLFIVGIVRHSYQIYCTTANRQTGTYTHTHHWKHWWLCQSPRSRQQRCRLLSWKLNLHKGKQERKKCSGQREGGSLGWNKKRTSDNVAINEVKSCSHPSEQGHSSHLLL